MAHQAIRVYSTNSLTLISCFFSMKQVVVHVVFQSASSCQIYPLYWMFSCSPQGTLLTGCYMYVFKSWHLWDQNNLAGRLIILWLPAFFSSYLLRPCHCILASKVGDEQWKDSHCISGNYQTPDQLIWWEKQFYYMIVKQFNLIAGVEEQITIAHGWHTCLKQISAITAN